MPMATDPTHQPEIGAATGRRTIATYAEYSDAERAVDALSDRDFPVGRVAIVGTGLRYVEQVGGRVTTGRAALMGAGQGAMIGLLFALLFGLFLTAASDFLGVLVYGLVAGAIFGAIFGAIGHAATGGRRDFASVSGMRAERYELQVDDEVADRAVEVLREAGQSLTG
jgi:hypothetical protein